MRLLKAGARPLVEILMIRPFLLKTAGTMNDERDGSSTILAGMRNDDASSDIRLFTAGSDVAAMTMNAPEMYFLLYADLMRAMRPLSAKACMLFETRKETTLTLAPAL